MKYAMVVVIALLILVPLLCGTARADGFMVPDEATWKMMMERSYINEPEQKAVIFFSKGKEDLIISPSYEGAADRFAWIIPVPARPKVDILKGALFHELKDIVAPPRPPAGKSLGKQSAPALMVEVLERKVVGAYDVSVLRSSDGKALLNWLKANKYHVPPKALGPINYYVKQKWTFVACRVNVPKSAKGLRTGTLAPLRMTFPAKQPVYPLRLSSANPRQFSMLVYLLVPSREVRSDLASLPIVGATGRLANRMDMNRYANVWPTAREHMIGKYKYPTMMKLSREMLRVFMVRAYLRPEACTSDCVWRIRD